MAITLDGDNLSTVGVINSATAKASTSGTSIDFTGIPSGVKRITVMLNGVSTNGTSNIQVQLGYSGGIENTGYSSVFGYINSSGGAGSSTATSGFVIALTNANNYVYSGSFVFTNLSGNTWVCAATIAEIDTSNRMCMVAGTKTLAGTLTQVRITTVNGTDTFDAGSINILYE